MKQASGDIEQRRKKQGVGKERKEEGAYIAGQVTGALPEEARR